MTTSIFTSEKINQVANEWDNLTFKTWSAENKNRLYISKMVTLFGYIDLNTGDVYPNQKGISRRDELESIVSDLEA